MGFPALLGFVRWRQDITQRDQSLPRERSELLARPCFRAGHSTTHVYIARPDIGRGRDALLRDPPWHVQKRATAIFDLSLRVGPRFSSKSLLSYFQESFSFFNRPRPLPVGGQGENLDEAS